MIWVIIIHLVVSAENDRKVDFPVLMQPPVAFVTAEQCEAAVGSLRKAAGKDAPAIECETVMVAATSGALTL